MIDDRKGEAPAPSSRGDARSTRTVPANLSAWLKDETREIQARETGACWCGVCHTNAGSLKELPVRNPSLHFKINRAKRAIIEGSWRSAARIMQTSESLKKLLKG